MNETEIRPEGDATRRIDTITNITLAAIVIIPFVLSASALADMAEANGIRPAFLYPIMVDGGLIIFKLIVLRAALRGQRDYYAWSMAITATIISVGLNVLHADQLPTADAVSWVMAALPPLAILAAFVAVTRRVQETAKEEGMHLGIGRLKRLVAEWEAKTEEAKAGHQAELAVMREKAKAEEARLEAKVGRLVTRIEVLAGQKEEAQTATREAKTLLQATNRAASTANAKAMKAKKDAAKPAKPTPATPANVEATPANSNGLTARQAAILQLNKKGKSRSEIAQELKISERTLRREFSTMNGLVKS